MSTISLLCLLTACVVRFVASSVGRSCQNLNPYINILRAKRVTIFEQSVNETAQNPCQTEWSRFGTCCELNSTKEYAKLQRQQVEVQFQRISQLMTQVNQSFNKFVTYAFHLNQSGYGELGKPFSDFIYMFLNLTKHPVLKPHLDNLEGVIHDRMFGKKNSTLPNMTETCKQTLMNLRTNSLCSVCSGRSNETFFDNTTQKAKLGTPHCKQILDACLDVFVPLTIYTTSAQFVVATTVNNAGYYLFLYDQSYFPMFTRFNFTASYMQFINLNQRLMVFNTTSDQSMKSSLEKTLCNWLVRISKDFFLDFWVDQLDQLLRFMNSFYDRADFINKQWKFVNSNFPKRILQQQPQINATTEFMGDVLTTDFVGPLDNVNDETATVLKMNLQNSSLWQ